MDRSTELRLPTVVVAVRIVVSGKSAVDAELFAAAAPRHGRGELIDDVAEMLDGDDPFVPVRIGGNVRLVGKAAIAWVAIRRRDPDALPSREFPEEPSEVILLYDRRHRVEIALPSPTEPLRGFLLDSSPADRPRVIDHLNSGPRFVRLWTPDEQVLVNRSLIVEVVELPEEES
jgi:hypothetical protein